VEKYVEVKPSIIKRPTLVFGNKFLLEDSEFDESAPATWNLGSVTKASPSNPSSLEHTNGAQNLSSSYNTGTIATAGLLQIGFPKDNKKYPKLHILRIAKDFGRGAGEVNWLKKFATDQLIPALQSYGFNISSHEVTEVEVGKIYNRTRKSISEKLSEAYDKWTAMYKNKEAPSLILVILPNAKKDIPLYSDIKWWSDCVVGIPTACVTHGAIDKFKSNNAKDRAQLPNFLANIW
jgi:hypothetical protein